VIAWRRRYAREGLTGQLADRPRRGRPRTVRRARRAEILATTLAPPPEHLGVTHWSTRLLAEELGCSHSTIARVWAEHNVKPWQAQTFKFSTDPQLEAKLREVVGLYLDPPEHAIVVCVDEKSQIQALERTQPVRAVEPGRPERHTHDYIRHGTATLFAALEVATGHVTDQLASRHRHSEFLSFLKQVAGAYPRRQLHVVCDNYATHKHVRVGAWLVAHPRVHLHFTPTYASWLNLVEVFFAILERQALRRGDFASVEDLMAAIRRFVAGWNQRCQPFVWTKDAEQILTKLQRGPAEAGSVGG
jgi:transposase